MSRRRADIVIGLLVAAFLGIGGVLSWQAYQQQRAIDQMMGSMMGTSMEPVHGTNPLWYVLGTLFVSAAIGGLYLAVRDNFSAMNGSDQPENFESSGRSQGMTDSSDSDSQLSRSITPEEQPQARILDLLPDDERRILEPVLFSPGITQIELRDRSEFSKSKVSQTVSALEKRGLLYRERQGRTFRVYPSDGLRQNYPPDI